MGFPYIIQLQNIDTNQRHYHQINSSSFNQVFNDLKQINYDSIIQYILMYEPQCNKDMLLIMYQQQQYWIFMNSEFFKDIKNIPDIQQSADKIRQSKFGSRVTSINSSQIQSLTATTSTKNGQRTKIILSVRFQCQGWVDQTENYQTSMIFQKSLLSQKDQIYTNLSEKVYRTKNQIKQMQKISNQLHMIQAQSLGINIFWASPYYSTDGIMRKPPKGSVKVGQQQKQKKSKQFLKNSVKCMPYIRVASQQIVQSNKKVVLNIEQFNSYSFARRNIFKVVYIICHTECIELKKKDIKNKFKKNILSNNQSTISQSQLKNETLDNLDYVKQEIRKSFKSQKMSQIKERIVQEVIQQQQQASFRSTSNKIKFKKTQSAEYIQNQNINLLSIKQEIDEDRITERKPSQDTNCRQQLFDDQLNLNESLMFQNKFSKQSCQKNVTKLTQNTNNFNQRINQFQNPFEIQQAENLHEIFAHQQYQYKLKKNQRKRPPARSILSRSNSKKSVSSKKNSSQLANSRSKKKIKQEKQPLRQFTSLQKIAFQNFDHQNQFNLIQPQIKKNKKKYKNSKKTFKQKEKKIQENLEINQKQTLSYFIGQSKTGQLQKITPQDLDDMLSQKKLQNIQLLILHTSFPYYHLPILKKHANNIIVINSNPIFPEACTIFFIKMLFKYLLQTKNISISYDKAISQTKLNYKNQSNFNISMNLSRVNSVLNDKNQKVKVDPFIQNVNKKYIRGGAYTCCCFHRHEPWCNFKANKSTSKYAQAHFKFHINRCECNNINIMQHSCLDKFSNLSTFNIIDKKNYSSTLVYDCCCQGVKQGRYNFPRKNVQYNPIINDWDIDDPHSMEHKYLLLKQNVQQINTNSKQNIPQARKNSLQKSKQHLSIFQGQVQGNSSESFISSIKYLTENQLIGNSQLIVNLLEFFCGQLAVPMASYIKYDQQSKKTDSKILNQSLLTSKPNKKITKTTTNSILRQSMHPILQASEINSNVFDIFQNQARICNLHGQNSSGRKTISKYLANLMVVKNIFSKYVIKYFSKIEQLRQIQVDQKNPQFYIFVYILPTRGNQLNLNQLNLSAQKIPDGLNAIIITNKRIKFDKSIKYLYQSPKPFNKQQIQTYVKMYEHLNSQQKGKLKILMDITSTNQQKKQKSKVQSMSIYANRIDPYQIISILRISSYENKKYQKYLESLSKIHIQCLPQYVVMTGIIYETLKSFKEVSKINIKRKENFIQNIYRKLYGFMSEGKSFYFMFSVKSKKKQKKNSKTLIDQVKTKALTPELGSKQINAQQQKNTSSKIEQKQAKRIDSHSDRQFKQQIINIKNIQSFYPLIFQKFQKQITSKCLQPLKAFIYYTTLNQNKLYSLKNSQYFKIKQKYHHRNIHNEIKHFKSRNIYYEPQFYQSTTINSNSFIYNVLKKQIHNYSTYLDTRQQILSCFKNSKIKQTNLNQNQQNLNKNINFQEKLSKNIRSSIVVNQKQQKGFIGIARIVTQEYFQNQKLFLNEFFLNYCLSLKQSVPNYNNFLKHNKKYSSHIDKQTNKIVQNSNCYSKSTKSQKEIIEVIDSPQKLKNRYQSMNSKKLNSHQSCLSSSQKQFESLSQLKSRKDSSARAHNSQNIHHYENINHLQKIAEAGLFYLRSTICSHLIYDLLQSNQAIQILKAGLILINNSIILLKSPQKKSQQKNDDLLESQDLSQNQDYQIQPKQDKILQNNNLSKQIQETDSSYLYQNQTSTKIHQKQTNLNNINNSFTNKSVLVKNQASLNISKLQKQKFNNKLYSINPLLSIKGLLYLLFKIRQRCDRLLLNFTDQKNHKKMHVVSQLCVLSQLFTVQLHLVSIFKGQVYQQKIIEQNSSQKHQKYLNKIFYDKFRSINYLKQIIPYLKIDSQVQQILQAHILSAYIMITTNGGRKRINQNLCDEINKIKIDLDDKSGRRDSVHDIKINRQYNQKLTSDKIKFLTKISQNKEVFLKLFTIFSSFKNQQLFLQYQKQSSDELKLQKSPHYSQRHKHEQSQKQKYIQQHHSQSPSFKKLSHTLSQYSNMQNNSKQQSPNKTIKLFKTQIQLYLHLLDIYHDFELQIVNLNSCQLYSELYRIQKSLTNDKIKYSLELSSNYIHQFYQDLYSKIKNHIEVLKEKFILFLIADPIESSKLSFIKHSNQSNQDIINKKRIEYEGNHRTIILRNTINELNQKLNVNNVDKNQNLKVGSKMFRNESQLQKNTNHSDTKGILKMNEPKNEQQHEKELKRKYNYFVLQKKLNQQTLKQISQSFGCKYLCIDSTMCASNQRYQIIGQNQAGQIMIFQNNYLAQLIQKTSANVIFICLPKKFNLAQCLINRWTKKQLIYFNFQKNIRQNQHSTKNKSKQYQDSSSSKNTSISYYLSNQKLNTYHRMIMQKVVSLIIQKMVEYQFYYIRSMKLKQAFYEIVNNHEFVIKNKQSEIIYHLANQELRCSVFCTSFRLQEQNDLTEQQSTNLQLQSQISESNSPINKRLIPKFITIQLYEDDIVSAEQVHEVKNVLKQKQNVYKQNKSSIKIQKIKSFQKFFKILKTYLKDKQSYQVFYEIDLQNFKFPNKQKSGLFQFKQKKSSQNSTNIPNDFLRKQSAISSESQKRRRQKKHKQSMYESVKYSDKWKSEFFKYLLQQNLFNFLLSKKKGLIMFKNSDLLNQKNDKEEWTKKIFQNLFKLSLYDHSQKLNRYVNKVKISLIKEGSKKNTQQATLFFIQNSQ